MTYRPGLSPWRRGDLDAKVLAEMKRLKQAELNDEAWCDQCRSYFPCQQVALIGNDWLCDRCRLKDTN